MGGRRAVLTGVRLGLSIQEAKRSPNLHTQAVEPREEKLSAAVDEWVENGWLGIMTLTSVDRLHSGVD